MGLLSTNARKQLLITFYSRLSSFHTRGCQNKCTNNHKQATTVLPENFCHVETRPSAKTGQPALKYFRSGKNYFTTWIGEIKTTNKYFSQLPPKNLTAFRFAIYAHGLRVVSPPTHLFLTCTVSKTSTAVLIELAGIQGVSWNSQNDKLWCSASLAYLRYECEWRFAFLSTLCDFWHVVMSLVPIVLVRLLCSAVPGSRQLTLAAPERTVKITCGIWFVNPMGKNNLLLL